MSRVTLDRISVLVDEEFLKVPRNVGPLHRLPNEELGVAHQTLGVVLGQRQLLLQPLEHGVLGLAVDLDLVEHLEVGLVTAAGTHVLQGLHDLLTVGVLLMPELVARESQDFQIVSELLLQRVKLSEVPDGGAS